MSLNATIAATAADISTLEITICKNGACVTTRPTATGTSFVCNAIGPLTTTCRITPSSAGATSQVELRITGLVNDFVDGDDYAIKIGRPNMTPIFSIERTINPYETSRPNGPLCEPLCRFADLPG